jgi:Tol biopolymer transport system component
MTVNRPGLIFLVLAGASQKSSRRSVRHYILKIHLQLPAAIGFALSLFLSNELGSPVRAQEMTAEASRLKAEVSAKGWLLFSQKTEAGDYDLFICRPDGSAKRNLTHSPEWVEFGGRFSPDGRRMLYRRLEKLGDSKRGLINHDLWGALGSLVIANADGSNPQPIGESGQWPWACWSPDGKQISCLYKREGKIRLFDLETKKLVKEMPRQGIFQQLYWSGDSKRLCGTANLNGQDWNIVSIDLDSGKLSQLSRDLCCTPDWFQGDANRVIYSCRVPGVGGEYGWTMLMQASTDGQNRTLVYGERERHIYYGCTSPDDKYVVFGVPVSDGGVDAEMALVRLADTPMVVPDDYQGLKALYPGAKSGPMLRLGQAGFEPHWTYAEIEGK